MNAELAERLAALEAERMRPERPDPRTEPVWADDFRALLIILARLLVKPGPPDPKDHEAEEVR
ncbi:hypothetical protein [Streptosporangium sp. CA-115845]|uniref:hypothetical protein n=1 Tax=Streptosporangium sp. CA-115845 TaxID=3240071 RepID=UPI003D90A977